MPKVTVNSKGSRQWSSQTALMTRFGGTASETEAPSDRSEGLRPANMEVLMGIEIHVRQEKGSRGALLPVAACAGGLLVRLLLFGLGGGFLGRRGWLLGLGCSCGLGGFGCCLLRSRLNLALTSTNLRHNGLTLDGADKPAHVLLGSRHLRICSGPQKYTSNTLDGMVDALRRLSILNLLLCHYCALGATAGRALRVLPCSPYV